MIDIDPSGRYQQVTIKLWGRGVVPRGEISGADIKGTARTRVRCGQFIVSKIDARNGAMGVVPPELDGALASNDFPTFDVDADRLRPSFLSWLSRTAAFVDVCKKASEGTTNRVRLSQDRMFGLSIRVPSPDEQDQIVATLDAAAARVAEAKRLCSEIESEANALLQSLFQQLAEASPRRPMAEVAPLDRRPATVSVLDVYPQVAVRSFGKGTFHRETLTGAEITWEQPFLVHAGDILISNIKAWEGAVAVAQPEDHGRYGSHRYLTCRSVEGVATPEWVAFFLLTREGLEHLGKASPGSADRNRTLGTKALMQIPIPCPAFDTQLWFGTVEQKLRGVRTEATRISYEAAAMLSSVLDRAFKGQLATTAVRTETASTGAGTVSSISTTSAASGDTAPKSAIMAPAHERVGVGKPVASGQFARTAGEDTVQTWHVPEIAAIQAELVRRNGGSATLGRKKISKGAYLAAALMGARQNPPPLRKAAGPFNTQGQNEVEAYATQAGWFRNSGLASGQRSSSRYRAGDRITEAAAKAKGLVAARAADFERFVGLFVNWDSDTAELHATAHAAWNGLIAAGKPVTEAAIIETFYEWSEEKAKFTASQIRAALVTLRSLRIVPDGRGPVVAGVGEENLFSDAN
ncbi:MAG: hypothetical protein SFY96_01545 [Planctomycetota bacterium]|nr:hypothetical protein [Planctomycetota bacterium]